MFRRGPDFKFNIQLSGPIGGGLDCISEILRPLFIFADVEASDLQIWYTTLVRRVECQKQLAGLKLAGVWA